jgi:hypothetical protein
VALRQAGAEIGCIVARAPFTQRRPATPAGASPAATVVVTRSFTKPVDLEAIQAIEDAGRHCLDTHRVTFLRTFFSNHRLRMVCLYRAPDAESVRLAQHQAGMPVERVWTCQPLVWQTQNAEN